MNKIKKIIIICILFIIIGGGIFKAYKSEDTKIAINMNDSLLNNNLLGLNIESKITKNIIHKIRYSNIVKITDRLISISDDGRCYTILNIVNGKIYNVWFDNNCIYLVYQNGEDFYSNSNENLRLYVYNYKEGKKISEEFIQKRIWGIDYLDSKPIYDKEDIDIEYGLSSNIYCSNTKRLYMDGRTLVEYNKGDKTNKSVLELDEVSYITIGELTDFNNYVLIQINEENKIKILLLNHQYEVISEKEIDFVLKQCTLGDQYIVLIDENDNILKLGEELEVEPFSMPEVDINEKILELIFDPEHRVFNIVTTEQLIIMDNKFENIIKTYKLSERLYNFDNLSIK